jgi:hypothetical protein
MSSRRYRLILKQGGKAFDREIELNSDEPIKHVINWAADEYEFKAIVKEIWWLRNGGAEERIY